MPSAGAVRFAPVTLSGRHVRLEPMSLAHLDGLRAAGADPEIFAWYPFPVSGAQNMRAFVESALKDQEQGKALPFVFIEPATGAVIGSSRFGAIEASHRRAEIGWTWLTPRVQRTPVNTEAKLLMLGHAFEALQLIRVEFKTDSLNQKSRNALLRIGAAEEGTFRNHMVTHSGRLRHSVYFSVIDADWPAVKARLEDKLARPRAVLQEVNS